MRPATPKAYRLFHEGCVALAQVESNGIRVDMDYLNKKIPELDKKIKKEEERLRGSAEFKIWKRVFGASANIGSGKQLCRVLFVEMKIPCKNPNSYDEANLQDVDNDFVRDYRQLTKWKKTKTTFLEGIKNEVAPDGFLRSFFNLAGGGEDEEKSGPVSYRSASEAINFQNFPVRNEEMSRTVRSSFISRGRKYCLLEADFSGIEVGVAACYNEDPILIDYVKNSPPKDMHRDMAAQCYKLEPSDIEKKSRYCAKNMFVFPQFYGSYYIDCARSLWDALDRHDLTTTGGKKIKEHLREQGITKLGTLDPKQEPKPGSFEGHLKKVEKAFWGPQMFHVYEKWKRKAWEDYQNKGYFTLHTGFVCGGFAHNRKQVINYRIQGAAFHCLLWVLIQLQKWLNKHKMKTRIVGQIHDSIIIDCHKSERRAVIEKLLELMTVDLPHEWKWIIVPLKAEIEVSPYGGNWFDKEKITL